MTTRYQPLPSRKLAQTIDAIGSALGWGEMQQKSHVFNDTRGSILDYTSIAFYWTSKCYQGRELNIFPVGPDNGGLTRKEVQNGPRPFAKLDAKVLAMRHRLYVGSVVFAVPAESDVMNLVQALMPILGFDNFASAQARKDIVGRFPKCRQPRLRAGETFFPPAYQLVRGKLVEQPPCWQAVEQEKHFANQAGQPKS